MRISLTGLLVGPLIVSSCATPVDTPPDVDVDLSGSPYLVVLGTAQDGGLPQIACQKECCKNARADPARRRLVTSLLLVDPRDGRRWLFDATPDIAEQVERAHGLGGPDDSAPGRPALFDGIFLTHAHLGHFVGLLQLGKEAYGSAPVTLIGTERMTSFLQENGPWSLLFDGGFATAQVLAPGGTLQLADDLSITAIQVPHRDEFSDTVAFVIRGPERAVLYLPDIDKWERWDVPLEDALADVDLAFIDGSFFGPAELPGRDMSAVPHPFIVESLERIAPLSRALRDRVWFTHLNHSNPAADPASDAARTVRESGSHVLADGQRFSL